jgi:hypothetical protein
VRGLEREVPGIDAIGLRLEEARQQRHQGLYDEVMRVGEADFREMLAIVVDLLPLARRGLEQIRPGIPLDPLPDDT